MEGHSSCTRMQRCFWALLRLENMTAVIHFRFDVVLVKVKNRYNDGVFIVRENNYFKTR